MIKGVFIMKKMLFVGLLFSAVFGVFALDTTLIEQEILRLVNKQRVDNSDSVATG